MAPYTRPRQSWRPAARSQSAGPAVDRRWQSSRNYSQVDLSGLEGCQLSDAHFHLDKVCTVLGKPLAVNAFNGIKDTPGAPPESSVVLGIAITCFMLHQGSDLEVSSELLDCYEGFMQNLRIKMSCVHPVFAGLNLETPTKFLETADAVVRHLQMPGIVAAGE